MRHWGPPPRTSTRLQGECVSIFDAALPATVQPSQWGSLSRPLTSGDPALEPPRRAAPQLLTRRHWVITVTSAKLGVTCYEVSGNGNRHAGRLLVNTADA